MDAISIALIKNLLTQQDLLVNDIQHFSRKFCCSTKRIKQALQCSTGKMLLEYDPERGMLRTNKIVGVGYNIPFIVVEDKVFSYQDRLNKRMVVEHRKNADVKIPIKESEKTNLNYIRRQLHAAVTLNHIIKSIRTYDTWTNDQSSDVNQLVSCVKRYSAGNGLYEGISVKRMAELNRVPQRTMERILHDLINLKIVRPIGRHMRIEECASTSEAYEKLALILSNNNKGCFYVSGKSIYQKKSNRYEMVSTNLLPRFHKIKSKTQKEKKNQDMRSWWTPVYGEYVYLPTYYNLVELNLSSKNFSEPDMDNKSATRKHLVFETLTNKNKDVLKGKTKIRVAPSTTKGLFDYQMMVAKKQWEELCSQDGEQKKKTIVKMSQSEFYQNQLKNMFLSIVDEFNYKEKVLNPKIKEMSIRLGITEDEARRRRKNTQCRINSKYKRLFKKVKDKDPKAKVMPMWQYIKVFNAEDSKIQEEFPMSYEEFCLNFMSINVWNTKGKMKRPVMEPKKPWTDPNPKPDPDAPKFVRQDPVRIPMPLPDTSSLTGYVVPEGDLDLSPWEDDDIIYPSYSSLSHNSIPYTILEDGTVVTSIDDDIYYDHDDELEYDDYDRWVDR